MSNGGPRPTSDHHNAQSCPSPDITVGGHPASSPKEPENPLDREARVAAEFLRGDYAWPPPPSTTAEWFGEA